MSKNVTFLKILSLFSTIIDSCWSLFLLRYLIIDFTTTNSSSFSSVEYKNKLFSEASKDILLKKYEDENMFPISTKFMIGYSF